MWLQEKGETSPFTTEKLGNYFVNTLVLVHKKMTSRGQKVKSLNCYSWISILFIFVFSFCYCGCDDRVLNSCTLK